MRDSTSVKMADDVRKRHRRFVRQLLEAVDQRTFDVAGRLIDDASSTGLEVDQSTTSGPTVLHSVLVASAAAASADVVDVCRRLVVAGADLHRRDPVTGETSLHVAAKLDRSDVIDVLVDAIDVDVDAVSLAGWTPLGLAVESGCAASARSLIRAGCGVNKENDAFETPLMVCARQNSVDCARVLVEEARDLDPNWTDRERRTALIVAVQHGHDEVVRVLIGNNGCRLDAGDQYGRTALYFAAKLGHVEIVKRLVSAGADLNKTDTKGLTPLSMAVEGLHMDVVRLLINAGCDVNTADIDNKQTALHNAVRFSSKLFGQRDFNLELVRLLVASRCDVNVADRFGITPLYQAASGGETDIVRLLLDEDADVTRVTDTMDTPLHGAVIGNQPEITDMLINAGCNVNLVNNKNKLPLYLAIESRAKNQFPSDLECLRDVRSDSDSLICSESARFLRCRVPMTRAIVESLLKAGSMTDVCESKNHHSPLYAAVSQQFVEAVRLLIDAGCDVNLPDADGSTPLLIACSHGNESIVDALMRHPKIDVDRGTLQVPLHSAASVGSRGIVERLIDAGCDVNKIHSVRSTLVVTRLTLTGLSALFQAADRDHIDVARLLIERGASTLAVARQLRPGSLCCRAHRDPHPHLELHPLFAAVENNSMPMIKLLIVASPKMPYAELAMLRDIIFRTKYAAEARLADRTVLQYGYLFTGVLSRPRSLSDECRGAIRDAVSFGRGCRRRPGGDRRLTMAEAVNRLPLPDRLKEYVLLRNEAILRSASGSSDGKTGVGNGGGASSG